MRRIFTLVLITLLGSGLMAQIALNEIDYGRIEQKKVRNYLNLQQQSLKRVSDFKASCTNCCQNMAFHVMENVYIIKDDPKSVWAMYKNINIAESWTGRLVSFGVLFSKWSDFVCYRNSDQMATADTGQVFFINLRLLSGFYNLPVGVEIVAVNEQERFIHLSYIDGGKSTGDQIIQIEETPEGYTKVIHTSAFKSDSNFRDKYLYPHFHTKILNEYHRNMAMRLVKNQNDFIIN